MNLKDALRSQNVARERDLEDRQRFDPLVCQCCGHAKRRDSDLECVCDGLNWYMIPGGGVECEAHKFARAIGKGKRTFLIGKRK